MSWRVNRINQEVKKHDPLLFAVKAPNGAIQVWRRANRWEASYLMDETTAHSQPMQFIIALTDNWKPDGTPVDRGIDPLLFQIRQMDSWNHGSKIEEMRKRREREESDKKRQRKNENRAIAADLRTEFAKATNDINTSTVDMTDARRKYGDHK